MNRRRLLAAFGGAAFAGPIAAVAQQASGLPRIGVLMGASPSVEAERLDAFRGALEKLGYNDGQTILIELRYAMGQPERFGALARELVAMAPAVIACVGRQETVALQGATRTIPIVFMQVHDPVEMGFVASLARPGGNTTGFTQMSAELDSTRLGLLHEIAPSLSRAAFLVNPNLTPGLQERFAGAQAAAKSLGIALRRGVLTIGAHRDQTDHRVVQQLRGRALLDRNSLGRWPAKRRAATGGSRVRVYTSRPPTEP